MLFLYVVYDKKNGEIKVGISSQPSITFRIDSVRRGKGLKSWEMTVLLRKVIKNKEFESHVKLRLARLLGEPDIHEWFRLEPSENTQETLEKIVNIIDKKIKDSPYYNY